MSLAPPAGMASDAVLDVNVDRVASDTFLDVDIDQLREIKNPVWTEVNGVLAYHLGWGNVPQQNLALRKRIGRPGAPFGGLGLFDPQKNVSEVAEPEPGAPPEDLTAERVKQLKVEQFQLCAIGARDRSVYLWTLQLLFDVQDRVRGAEILIRLRNGADSAPFEDVIALMTPEMVEVYAKWKVAEILDFALQVFKNFPPLLRLNDIAVNVRPLDMPTDTLVYKELVRRLGDLSTDDRELLREKVVIEVTEDQMHPDNFEITLKAWQALGFKLSYDDAIGSKASKELKSSNKSAVTFHTPEVLAPLIDHFHYIKVDIDWAGYIIFLSHPSYANRADVKAKVLEHVKEKGTVMIPKGPNMIETEVTHDDLCAELADMCKVALKARKCICIELTVRADDANNAYAIEKLKGMGVDIFGEHQDSFLIQGGLTGAKAFTPEALAGCIRMEEVSLEGADDRDLARTGASR